jgi:hypothetical protein
VNCWGGMGGGGCGLYGFYHCWTRVPDLHLNRVHIPEGWGVEAEVRTGKVGWKWR